MAPEVEQTSMAAAGGNHTGVEKPDLLRSDGRKVVRNAGVPREG